MTKFRHSSLAEPHFLEQHFGSHAIDLKERAQGIDNRVIDPNSIYEFKSIGHSTR